MKIGLDIMGGDYAPKATVLGAIAAHQNLSENQNLVLFGDKEQMSSTFYLGAFIVLFVVLLNGIIKNRSILKEKFQQKWNRKK